jgi:hypothetical protein
MAKFDRIDKDIFESMSPLDKLNYVRQIFSSNQELTQLLIDHDIGVMIGYNDTLRHPFRLLWGERS